MNLYKIPVFQSHPRDSDRSFRVRNTHLDSNMRPVHKIPSCVLWKIETFIEEDTRHKKCTQDNDASVPFKVGTLGPHTVLQLPSAIPLYFPESHWRSAMSSFSMVILVSGKARSCRAPNLGCRGPESPGWFDVLSKTLHKRMHGWARCCHDAVNH